MQTRALSHSAPRLKLDDASLWLSANVEMIMATREKLPPNPATIHRLRAQISGDIIRVFNHGGIEKLVSVVFPLGSNYRSESGARDNL